MALMMLFSFASCGGKDTEETTSQQDVSQSFSSEEVLSNDSVADETVSQSGSALVTGETVSGSGDTTTQPTSENAAAENDPSEWTDEEIVAFYKAAAIKSQPKVKSVQKMTMEEMVVNEGDGVLGTLVEWATPFLINALEENSKEFDGLTGGYEKLELSDTQSVKAYKSGEYTVIEMTLKEQTDGIHGESTEGTVGHAISVVGDISAVQEALPMFEIDFENADVRLHYSNPKLKVKINNDGIIEKGTWSYTVKINVNHLRIDAVNLPIGATVDTGRGSVGYINTVGGGF